MCCRLSPQLGTHPQTLTEPQDAQSSMGSVPFLHGGWLCSPGLLVPSDRKHSTVLAFIQQPILVLHVAGRLPPDVARSRTQTSWPQAQLHLAPPQCRRTSVALLPLLCTVVHLWFLCGGPRLLQPCPLLWQDSRSCSQLSFSRAQAQWARRLPLPQKSQAASLVSLRCPPTRDQSLEYSV